jgi:uncharacterized membrane protein YphA (DoxX/SURF4 family)
MTAAANVRRPLASRSESRRSLAPYALWGAQIVLAAIFLFAGVMKFVMSAEEMTRDIDLPIAFLRFIGVCEVLGALAMILPGISGIQRKLTPIAAMGLIVIMIGATSITIGVMGVVPALYPFVVGLVALFVAYGRRSWLTA